MDSRNEYCCFDLLCRIQIDHINYEIIESIKKGGIFSSKFDSTPKLHIGGIKLIIFMNVMPYKGNLSKDHVDIYKSKHKVWAQGISLLWVNPNVEG